jgi:hypothetical protein
MKIIESLDLFSYKTDTLRSLRLERSGRCIQSFGLYVMPQDKHLFTAETQRAQRDCSFHVPLRRRHMKNTRPAALVPLRRTRKRDPAQSCKSCRIIFLCVCLRQIRLSFTFRAFRVFPGSFFPIRFRSHQGMSLRISSAQFGSGSSAFIRRPRFTTATCR